MNDESVKQLNVLIALQVDRIMNPESKAPSLISMVSRLKSLGLSNPEIGTIFNKTPDQVAKLFYEATGRKNAKKISE